MKSFAKQFCLLTALTLLMAFAGCVVVSDSENNTDDPSDADLEQQMQDAQVKSGSQDLSADEVPFLNKLPGQFKMGKSWTDEKGNNCMLVLTSERSSSTETEELVTTIRIMASLYQDHDGNWQKIAEHTDAVEQCGLEVVLAFHPEILLADANSDGRAEAYFMYDSGCFGDIVGPDTYLVVMDGSTKYTISGHRAVVEAPNKNQAAIVHQEETQQVPSSLQNAPQILNEAHAFWKKHINTSLYGVE